MEMNPWAYYALLVFIWLAEQAMALMKIAAWCGGIYLAMVRPVMKLAQKSIDRREA